MEQGIDNPEAEGSLQEMQAKMSLEKT